MVFVARICGAMLTEYKWDRFVKGMLAEYKFIIDISGYYWYTMEGVQHKMSAILVS